MTCPRAIVRPPGRTYARCVSSHPLRHTIDPGRARAQHATYVSALKDLGVDVIELPSDDVHPDSCFVEDSAVVHGGRALICRPAVESRRGEVAAVETELSKHMQTRRAVEPATVEGGDVLHLWDRLVSGVTERTNEDGVRQMASWLGTRVDTISAPGIMHLKSHVSSLRKGTVLVAREYEAHPSLSGLERLVVPDGEGYAANVLHVGGTGIMPLGYPRTEKLLEDSGLDVVSLEMGEFPKCEGAMTCLSILF